MITGNDYIYKPLSKPIPITEHVWPEGTLPLVHTRTMAYMHENYIQECIEGILMQCTTFPVLVLIHDDASTDRTGEIIREYEQKYPRLIKTFCQKENTHTKINRRELRAEFASLRIGKYEALCDGDDYWVDPLKLQKQVVFLENNPEYGLSYSKVKYYHQKLKKYHTGSYGTPISSVEDLIIPGKQVPTSTVCFRMDLVNQYHAEINTAEKNWIYGDRSMWTWFAFNSKLHFISQISGVYRVLGKSLSHKNTYEDIIKLRVNFYEVKYYYINLYNLHHLTKTIDNSKYFQLSTLAIYFKKYDDYNKYIAKIESNSRNIIIKKIIGKSKVLMFLFHKFVKKRSKGFLKIYKHGEYYDEK